MLNGDSTLKALHIPGVALILVKTNLQEQLEKLKK
jgi:hypothetical protein